MFLVYFYVSDHYVDAITKPVTVTMNEANSIDYNMTHNNEKLSTPVLGKIAYLGETSSGEHKYLDLQRNKCFTDVVLGWDSSYNSYLDETKRVKLIKLSKANDKLNEEHDLMMRLMKASILAVCDKIASTGGKKNKSQFVMPDKVKIYVDVVSTYFRMGVNYNVSVNRPDEIFDSCMKKHSSSLKEIVCGKKRMNEGDSTMVNQASLVLMSTH